MAAADESDTRQQDLIETVSPELAVPSLPSDAACEDVDDNGQRDEAEDHPLHVRSSVEQSEVQADASAGADGSIGAEEGSDEDDEVEIICVRALKEVSDEAAGSSNKEHMAAEMVHETAAVSVEEVLHQRDGSQELVNHKERPQQLTSQGDVSPKSQDVEAMDSQRSDGSQRSIRNGFQLVIHDAQHKDTLVLPKELTAPIILTPRQHGLLILHTDSLEEQFRKKMTLNVLSGKSPKSKQVVLQAKGSGNMEVLKQARFQISRLFGTRAELYLDKEALSITVGKNGETINRFKRESGVYMWVQDPFQDGAHLVLLGPSHKIEPTIEVVLDNIKINRVVASKLEVDEAGRHALGLHDRSNVGLSQLQALLGPRDSLRLWYGRELRFMGSQVIHEKVKEAYDRLREDWHRSLERTKHEVEATETKLAEVVVTKRFTKHAESKDSSSEQANDSCVQTALREGQKDTSENTAGLEDRHVQEDSSEEAPADVMPGEDAAASPASFEEVAAAPASSESEALAPASSETQPGEATALATTHTDNALLDCKALDALGVDSQRLMLWHAKQVARLLEATCGTGTTVVKITRPAADGTGGEATVQWTGTEDYVSAGRSLLSSAIAQAKSIEVEKAEKVDRVESPLRKMPSRHGSWSDALDEHVDGEAETAAADACETSPCPVEVEQPTVEALGAAASAATASAVLATAVAKEAAPASPEEAEAAAEEAATSPQEEQGKAPWSQVAAGTGDEWQVPQRSRKARAAKRFHSMGNLLQRDAMHKVPIQDRALASTASKLGIKMGQYLMERVIKIGRADVGKCIGFKGATVGTVQRSCNVRMFVEQDMDPPRVLLYGRESAVDAAQDMLEEMITESKKRLELNKSQVDVYELHQHILERDFAGRVSFSLTSGSTRAVKITADNPEDVAEAREAVMALFAGESYLDLSPEEVAITVGRKGETLKSLEYQLGVHMWVTNRTKLIFMGPQHLIEPARREVISNIRRVLRRDTFIPLNSETLKALHLPEERETKMQELLDIAGDGATLELQSDSDGNYRLKLWGGDVSQERVNEHISKHVEKWRSQRRDGLEQDSRRESKEDLPNQEGLKLDRLEIKTSWDDSDDDDQPEQLTSPSSPSKALLTKEILVTASERSMLQSGGMMKVSSVAEARIEADRLILSGTLDQVETAQKAWEEHKRICRALSSVEEASLDAKALTALGYASATLSPWHEHELVRLLQPASSDGTTVVTVTPVSISGRAEPDVKVTWKGSAKYCQRGKDLLEEKVAKAEYAVQEAVLDGEVLQALGFDASNLKHWQETQLFRELNPPGKDGTTLVTPLPASPGRSQVRVTWKGSESFVLRGQERHSKLVSEWRDRRAVVEVPAWLVRRIFTADVENGLEEMKRAARVDQLNLDGGKITAIGEADAVKRCCSMLSRKMREAESGMVEEVIPVGSAEDYRLLAVVSGRLERNLSVSFRQPSDAVDLGADLEEGPWEANVLLRPEQAGQVHKAVGDALAGAQKWGTQVLDVAHHWREYEDRIFKQLTALGEDSLKRVEQALGVLVQPLPGRGLRICVLGAETGEKELVKIMKCAESHISKLMDIQTIAEHLEVPPSEPRPTHVLHRVADFTHVAIHEDFLKAVDKNYDLTIHGHPLAVKQAFWMWEKIQANQAIDCLPLRPSHAPKGKHHTLLLCRMKRVQEKYPQVTVEVQPSASINGPAHQLWLSCADDELLLACRSELIVCLNFLFQGEYAQITVHDSQAWDGEELTKIQSTTGASALLDRQRAALLVCGTAHQIAHCTEYVEEFHDRQGREAAAQAKEGSAADVEEVAAESTSRISVLPDDVISDDPPALKPVKDTFSNSSPEAAVTDAEPAHSSSIAFRVQAQPRMTEESLGNDQSDSKYNVISVSSSLNEVDNARSRGSPVDSIMNSSPSSPVRSFQPQASPMAAPESIFDDEYHWYYIDDDEIIQGPFDTEEMREWWDENLLPEDLSVCCLTAGEMPPYDKSGFYSLEQLFRLVGVGSIPEEAEADGEDEVVTPQMDSAFNELGA